MGCQPSTDSGAKKPKKQPHLLQEIKDHKSGINCMVLSDDGSMLVTGSDDKTARMWSTLSDPTECLGVLEGHEGYITCCAVHEQCVITGSSDSSIRKWFIATAECQAIYVGHSSRISRLLCVGQLIFSTSSDHTIRAWLFDLREISDDQGEACIKVFQVLRHWRNSFVVNLKLPSVSKTYYTESLFLHLQERILDYSSFFIDPIPRENNG
ncbi:WD repeat-containing protein 86 [Caerostris darwini]|uniref:WD repeat-containing protein 86 n=1 Tax=Caerostris darwini TaxID=1538125 RepID=A0AAV4PXC2_9ARAC|nr:WD repeat-containing protein 86 [Caerostris darwini]